MHSLDRLQIFLRVAEMRSFSRAAESLGTQKGRTSTVLLQLEEELGVRLLHRTTRSVQLTEDRRSFYQRARDVFDCIEMFCNPKRKHARNGMLTPLEFERQQKLKHEGLQETRGYSLCFRPSTWSLANGPRSEEKSSVLVQVCRKLPLARSSVGRFEPEATERLAKAVGPERRAAA